MANCPICGSDNVSILTAPHPTRSITSEGRAVSRPLEKASCNVCGYGFHVHPPALSERDQFYDRFYDVGQRDPEADRHRALEYSNHIRAFLSEHGISVPRESSIIEFGCGSGALLNVLATSWNVSEALGIEPATKLAAVARQTTGGNVRILEDYVENGKFNEGCYALVVSVNVVEHAFDPIAFLAAARTAVDQEGAVVVICPDGETPGSELLFRDHISSFTIASFARLAAQAELRLLATQALHGQQTGFRIFLLRPGATCDVDLSEPTSAGLSTRRDMYLKGWSELEEAALDALGQKNYTIFGVGEFADLLSAYSPTMVDRAAKFVVDRPMQHERGGRPVISLKQFLEEEDIVALAAVHPRNWPSLKSRFDVLGREAVHPYQFTSLRWML